MSELHFAAMAASLAAFLFSLFPFLWKIWGALIGRASQRVKISYNGVDLQLSDINPKDLKAFIELLDEAKKTSKAQLPPSEGS